MMRKILGKILQGILWLIKPRIMLVDKQTAGYMATFGGAKILGKRRTSL